VFLHGTTRGVGGSWVVVLLLSLLSVHILLRRKYHYIKIITVISCKRRIRVAHLIVLSYPTQKGDCRSGGLDLRANRLSQDQVVNSYYLKNLYFSIQQLAFSELLPMLLLKNAEKKKDKRTTPR
jgi:hypothetical protein